MSSGTGLHNKLLEKGVSDNFKDKVIAQSVDNHYVDNLHF